MNDAVEVRHGSLSVMYTRDGEFGRFVFEGSITDDALVACLVAVWQHPDYHFEGPELYDFRNADATGLTAAGVRALAESNAEHFTGRPDHRSAVVVDAPLMFGFGRMFSAFAGDRGDNVAVFEGVADASYWLRSRE